MYAWAVNQNKLARAIRLSKDKTEEDIKAIYESLGGLVREPVKDKKKKAE